VKEILYELTSEYPTSVVKVSFFNGSLQKAVAAKGTHFADLHMALWFGLIHSLCIIIFKNCKAYKRS
jgi:hypothetical protein